MPRLLTPALVLAATLVAGSASAALRAPQIAFSSAALQSRLNGFGESIDVLTQQQDGLVWGTTVSQNSTMTLQFQITGNPSGNEFGIAKLNSTGNAVVGLAQVFPVAAGTGSFAVASFRAGNTLIVNLFDENATLLSTTMHSGVNRSRFAYYVKNASGTHYSHEGFNADGRAHALAFAGTGINQGNWWMAWEDAPISNYANADFDDAVLFMESINPTPVARTSWGSLKRHFR